MEQHSVKKTVIGLEKQIVRTIKICKSIVWIASEYSDSLQTGNKVAALYLRCPPKRKFAGIVRRRILLTAFDLFSSIKFYSWNEFWWPSKMYWKLIMSEKDLVIDCHESRRIEVIIWDFSLDIRRTSFVDIRSYIEALWYVQDILHFIVWLFLYGNQDFFITAA